MLIDSDERKVEGPLDSVLDVVHGVVVMTLRDAGHKETVADELALRVVPRLERQLAQLGYVVRQVE